MFSSPYCAIAKSGIQLQVGPLGNIIPPEPEPETGFSQVIYNPMRKLEARDPQEILPAKE